MSTEVITKFNKQVNKIYTKVEDEFKRYKDEPNNIGLYKCLKNKYKYLKRFRINGRSKITTYKSYIYELFYINSINIEFTENERKKICENCINKIKGLYKHAQALKTGYCNSQIINGFSEEKTISICVTKNTLEANEQWLTRLFKELDRRFPRIKLNDKIMIISSKRNDLGGHATHCKNIDSAWKYFKKANNFKIVFICSNKTRIHDIYEIAYSFLNLREELRKDLRILHDEAHNKREGVPAFRDIIENIIILPNVISYMPISASQGEIADDKNIIWQKKNLEHNAIDFTDFDNTKSSDSKYSAIRDYKDVSFEELKKNEPNIWKDYKIKEVSRVNFINVTEQYKGKTWEELSDDEKNDIDYRKKLEFCKFMENDKEIEALNNGMNVLNYNSFGEFNGNYFLKDIFNFHVISTPNRKVLSYYLCKEAIKMDYNPIVLGIYGNQGEKYHLFIKGVKEMCIDDKMGSGEFNNKVYNLIKYLISVNINTDRPFIIIGNYTPTGESLSYVNYNYGIVRGVVKLISTNAEQDYQMASRGCFMNTKFKENDSNWVEPEKYLSGPNAFIENAKSYERENDARIDFLTNSNNRNQNNNIVLCNANSLSMQHTNGIVAIPIKIEVDIDDKNYEKIIAIATKKRRTKEDKVETLKLLKESVQDPESCFNIIDKTDKFDWNKITLKDFRCYHKDCQNEKGYWKFQNYKNNFETEGRFINNTSNHSANDCEILVCKDKYILKDNNNEVIERNSKNTWWISYKY